MAELIIRTGKHQGKKLVVSDAEVVIGRDESCRVRLASSEVSRRHCALRATPEGLVVRDLGSGNGTLVNDETIVDETLLHPGDTVRVGPLELQVPGKKKNASPPAESSIFTEDDIANWLSDDEKQANRMAQGETTVIRGDRLHQVAPASTKKQFRNIAEEAADIIRRHWESVEEEDV